LSADISVIDKEKHLQITVADTGTGFPKAVKNKIFNGFKVDPPNINGPLKQKGDGLGLASSKRIVKAHGGQIWAESREGVGATFSFALPFTREE